MSEPFEIWGVVEIMGHQRLAGKISEQEIAGQKFVRVDIPETPNQQPSTQFLGPSAIYRIRPIAEDLTRQIASRIDAMPVTAWDAQKFVDLKRVIEAPEASPVHELDRSFEVQDEDDLDD